jgi:4-hydroxybenzoyl-CoA thioesterase
MAYTSIQKIRFDDVDGAGIVYYPRFLHLCHAAFEDFFDDVAPFGYPTLIRTKRLGFPTVHIDADFQAPLSYGDIAVVTLAVTKIGTSSMTLRYDVRRKRDSTLCFEATITTVLIDLDTQRPVPMDDELRTVFSRYLAGPAAPPASTT